MFVVLPFQTKKFGYGNGRITNRKYVVAYRIIYTRKEIIDLYESIIIGIGDISYLDHNNLREFCIGLYLLYDV